MKIQSGSSMPQHVAIIMDGNGRWAHARGLPRSAGHRKGVEALRIAVRAAGELGIRYLTIFSFSSENWSRPPSEVSFLLDLMRHFVRQDVDELHRENVCIRIIGERSGLADDIVALIEETERRTRANTGLTLIVAFNYGSRQEIAAAARDLAVAVKQGRLAPESITPDLLGSRLSTEGVPDPDLLIRTSGEQRISNFLLWEIAYAELLFIDVQWPDFRRTHLQKCLDDYAARERRFGLTSAQLASDVES